MLLLEEKEGHYIDMITVVWSVNSLDDILFLTVGKLSKGKMRINNSLLEGRSPQGASSAEPASL